MLAGLVWKVDNFLALLICCCDDLRHFTLKKVRELGGSPKMSIRLRCTYSSNHSLFLLPRFFLFVIILFVPAQAFRVIKLSLEVHEKRPNLVLKFVSTNCFWPPLSLLLKFNLKSQKSRVRVNLRLAGSNSLYRGCEKPENL